MKSVIGLFFCAFIYSVMSYQAPMGQNYGEKNDSHIQKIAVIFIKKYQSTLLQPEREALLLSHNGENHDFLWKDRDNNTLNDTFNSFTKFILPESNYSVVFQDFGISRVYFVRFDDESLDKNKAQPGVNFLKSKINSEHIHPVVAVSLNELKTKIGQNVDSIQNTKLISRTNRIEISLSPAAHSLIENYKEHFFETLYEEFKNDQKN